MISQCQVLKQQTQYSCLSTLLVTTLAATSLLPRESTLSSSLSLRRKQASELAIAINRARRARSLVLKFQSRRLFQAKMLILRTLKIAKKHLSKSSLLRKNLMRRSKDLEASITSLTPQFVIRLANCSLTRKMRQLMLAGKHTRRFLRSSEDGK